MSIFLPHERMQAVNRRHHPEEITMKKTLILAGISSLLVASVLYGMDYTNYRIMASRVQVLIYPAAFFTLLGLVMLFRAVQYLLNSREN
jgi:hypothetical protein